MFHEQVLEPDKRLGSDEMGGFEKLKEHEFFKGIDWDHLEEIKPPALVPYLPATASNPEHCWSTMKVKVSLFLHNFYLVRFEEKSSYKCIAISRLLLSCKNFNVGHFSKSIEGINTKLGILAHHHKVHLQDRGHNSES